MSKLLINESPMMFQQTLATKIGLNEAIALQQVHYLLNPKFNKNINSGRHWVYNTYQEWKEKEFPFWSVETIKRTFLSLEKQALVDAKRLSKNSRDRTKWYSINYDNVSKLELVIGTTGQNDPMECHEVKMNSSIGSNCAVASGQNDPMSKVQENYLQENIKTNNTHAREAEPEPEVVEQSKAEPSIDLTADSVCEEPALEEKIPDEKPEPKAATPRQAKAKGVSQQEFELFWLAYALKVGKGAAVKAFDKALKKAPLETILAALEAQKAERLEREHLGLWSPSWKHPSTWLNQECWNDIPKTTNELQKEAEAKRVVQYPASQKKPNYSDKVEAANRATGNIMEKFYPDLAKYFPMFAPEPKLTDFNIPQLRQEVVINAI